MVKTLTLKATNPTIRALSFSPKGEPDVEVPEVPAKVRREYKRFVCHLCGAVMCYDSKVSQVA